MKRYISLLLLVIAFLSGYTQSVVTRDSLLNTFVTGARPTQQQFQSWINSYYHVDENLGVDYLRGLYLYGSGASTEETDGNIRFSFLNTSNGAISLRESGTWYDMLKFPTFSGLSGRFVSTTHSTGGILGYVLANQDTTGANGIIMALNTAGQDTLSFLQYRNRAEITSSQPLYINGTLWPPTGGGSPVWTDNGGGQIYYSGLTTRVGVNTSTPNFTFNVVGTDDLFATSSAVFTGASRTDGVAIRNDGSIIISGDQQVIGFNESLPSGTRSSLQWILSGATRGQIGMQDNDIVISTLAGGDFDGRVEFNSDTVLVEDGAFRVRSTSGSGLEVFHASDETGKVYTNKPHATTSISLRNTSSNPADVTAVRVEANTGDGAFLTPTADFVALQIDADSINPSGTDDVIGLSILMDTLQGLPRTADGVNPERTYPMRIFRGIVERGGRLQVATNEGDVDLIHPLYGGWNLSESSFGTATGTMSISSASQQRFTTPSIDTSDYSVYTTISSSNIRVSYDTIQYIGADDQYGRYNREVEVICNFSFGNTTATVAQYAIGISVDGDDALTTKRYSSVTSYNTKGVVNVTVVGQLTLEPGESVYPVITNNQGSALNTDVYQANCTLKSLD